MLHRQIDDRYSAARESLANLLFPDFPRVLAPEVIGPQEAALEQIVAEPFRLGGVEEGRAHFGHHDERALEQLRSVSRTTWCLGSFGAAKLTGVLVSSDKPDRQVDLGPG